MSERLLVRHLFLRVFGVILVVAFWSLDSQVWVLFGSRGLAPACDYLDSVRGQTAWWEVPTLFWFRCDDSTLRLASWAGMAASVAILLNVAPRYFLVIAWGLYLSFVSVGSPFLNFQWDNLVLETALFSWFVFPAGMRRGRLQPPHPIAVFLMQWLLFRLHFESGLAKLISGDPTWRDLTAMVSYYETAPLPTWVGWYAHQLPVWAHQASSAATYLVELIVPLFYWGPRRLRYLALAVTVGFHVAVLATANYGVFNYLALALCLFLLDDGDLRAFARRFGARSGPILLRRVGWLRTLRFAIALLALLPLSVLPFLRFLGQVPEDLAPLARAIAPWRSLNAYHLFATMTLIRREAVIVGSNDGVDWRAYELRYKPGDPGRRPPFVAPHQPRLDFQLWFLLLGNRWGAPYFDRLLAKLQRDPEAVRALLAHDPFPDAPPKLLRVDVYRYQFSDPATHEADGSWWTRSRIEQSRVLVRE